jgi:hypothetical protein
MSAHVVLSWEIQSALLEISVIIIILFIYFLVALGV